MHPLTMFPCSVIPKEWLLEIFIRHKDKTFYSYCRVLFPDLKVLLSLLWSLLKNSHLFFYRSFESVSLSIITVKRQDVNMLVYSSQEKTSSSFTFILS